MSQDHSAQAQANYDEVNLEDVKGRYKKDSSESSFPDKVFTMIQHNSRSTVTITEGNRKACAKAILG